MEIHAWIAIVCFIVAAINWYAATKVTSIFSVYFSMFIHVLIIIVVGINAVVATVELFKIGGI